VWDSSIHNYKLTETADDPDADEWDQYIFTVRRKFDWENKYTETVVDIKSKPLKEALNHIMEGVKGVSLVEETPVVDPNMLFLYLEESRTYMKELKGLAETEKKKKAKKAALLKAKHLKILVKYLDKDYAETKKTLYPLLESNTITFDLLWALFKPNDIAYCPTYGNADEPRAFKIEYATKESHFMKGQWYDIEGRYLEYDGKSFGMGTMSIDVEAFKGPRKITGLACYPLKYHKDVEGLKKNLIERGKKFVSLKGMNYRFHKGMAFYKKKKAIIKVNINGRIMVDPAIHRRINPNYAISTVKPKDPDILDNSDSDSDSNCSCCCDSDSDEGGTHNTTVGLGDEVKEKIHLKVVRDKSGRAHIVEVELDENGNEIRKEDIDKLETDSEERLPDFTEEELLIASPVVLGFAFSEKLWLEFTVSGIADIDWNEGAFDSLVLPDNQKSIVRALVESHTFHAAQNIDDVIQGKGRGLVAVLHGPPGTGKTLTAEGIAELLKCPLYMVSAGELGTDPRTLEGELNKILDIAHSWGAVLLLDEADVFLEKRTIQDIHRNALVSIFLRLLEYFQGILFLTTNRVETFDDAFQSRIHVALRYGELTTKAKRSVWKMFLERVRAKEGVEIAKFKEEDYNALARHNLNGRQVSSHPPYLMTTIHVLIPVF
jgi:SpoVK/Ycf46/Vps4 family AAA+-type ATPase